MPISLYGTPTSPFTNRVRLVAAFTGADLADRALTGALGSEDRKAITHFGKIPGLVVDDRVLIESVALMEYLVEIVGGHPLMPSDPIGRARVRGVFAAHDNWVLTAAWPMFLSFRSGKPDPDVIVPALQAAAEQYALLTRLFDEDGGFALLGCATLADLAIAPFALLFDRFYPMFGQESPFVTKERWVGWWRTVRAVEEVDRVLSAMEAALSRVAGR